MTEMILAMLRETWGVVLALSPWLLFGLFMAGVLHAVLPVGFIRRHLGGRGFLNVLWASLVGVPMPLCSCGVIPTSIGLKKDGASDGASVAFLISTPQTGVDSIMVSARFLGWPFALFKIFSALVTGLVGGQLTNMLDHEPVEASAMGAEEGFRGGMVDRIREMARFAFGRLLGDIYLWVVIGIVVSGMISALVPENYFADIAWMQGLPGMLVMLAISLPMYVCATSSVPIAASLVHAGLPTGAALVFLMAGPATNAATIGAIWRSFGRRVTFIYIGTVSVASVLLGLVFDGVLGAQAVDIGGMRHLLPHWVSMAMTSVLLLLILGHALTASLRRWKARPSAAAPASEDQVTLGIQGMTCQNCLAHVREALEAVEGVSSVLVDLKGGKAVVSGVPLSNADLLEAVKACGYEAAAQDAK